MRISLCNAQIRQHSPNEAAVKHPCPFELAHIFQPTDPTPVTGSLANTPHNLDI